MPGPRASEAISWAFEGQNSPPTVRPVVGRQEVVPAVLIEVNLLDVEEGAEGVVDDPLHAAGAGGPLPAVAPVHRQVLFGKEPRGQDLGRRDRSTCPVLVDEAVARALKQDVLRPWGLCWVFWLLQPHHLGPGA